MNTFQFSKEENPGSSESGHYDFTQESLVNIPYPEDTCLEEDGSLPMSEDVDLPPPPGAVDNEPLPPYNFRSSPPKIISQEEIEKINLPSSDNSKNKSNEPLPPFPFSSFRDNQAKNDQLNMESEGDLLEDAVNESKISDDSKYSPSKVESDDDNQDAAVRPKVLGKEQAKKRLMAFSLSKQINSGVKKQSKVLTPIKSSKEKPPNPNKSTNVQDQFRATITAIEEEKRKMMQNMPTYLLMEMSDLAKSTQAIPKSMKTEESEFNKNKEHNSSKSSDATRGKDSSKRSSRRSRSRSANRSKRRRRSRSRSRRRSRSASPSRRRSRSRNRRSRSRSRTKKTKDDKDKSSKTDKKEKNVSSKKDSAEDWKTFKASGLNFDNILDENNEGEQNQTENFSKRTPSPKPRQDFKPMFSYLKKDNKLMAPLRARPADHNKLSPVLYQEKFVKYTKSKPVIVWSENPSYATEFCMSKEMLLENCDHSTSEILQNIIESKNEADFLDAKQHKSRPWYPRKEYLSPTFLSKYDDLETDSKYYSEDEFSLSKAGTKIESNSKESNFEDCNENKQSKRERTLSLVNDSYLSDEDEKLKEVVVGDMKVQMDVGTNSVKVCSRWDSDYEEETHEIGINLPEKSNKQDTTEKQPKTSPKEKKMEGNKTELKKSVEVSESTNIKSHEGSDSTSGNLASEYEEFLKMVSFDSIDNAKTSEGYSVNASKTDAQKIVKVEEESKKITKLEATDWDQESEHDETSPVKKIPFSKSTPQSLLIKDEKLDISKKKVKKISKLKKKIDKSKIKKIKSKKDAKTKKKKYKDSSSSESSSDSYDSDSSSDSDDKKSRSKKKKKVKKIKKKSKKDSSSDSDSDSDDDKPKKKKTKKKKKEMRKKKDSESEEDDTQTTLLKQLDFKKQLIMKKIEEIDFISERAGKKKENRQKKKDVFEDVSEKSGAKKKIDTKTEKNKKKGKSGNVKGKENKESRKSSSSSESSSESEENKSKKKKTKKEKKKKRYSSESSEDEEKPKINKEKLVDIKNLKSEKKLKKAMKKKRLSSSDSSASDDSSDKIKKKVKKNKNKKGEEKTIMKEENSRSSWKENLLIESASCKVNDIEENLDWESRSLWDKEEIKAKCKKEEDDWEASSSVEGSPRMTKSRESSWNDEPPPKAKVDVVSEIEEKSKMDIGSEAPTGTLKTSLSNYSFNENSFCSFGQELSRDFFLADRSLSNTIMPDHSSSVSLTRIESRPFQSVSKNNEPMKPPASELYSPGHSDSDLSEPEINDKTNSNSNAPSTEVYDPLNCDSENSVENNEIEVGSIPLPQISDILLPGESKSLRNENTEYSSKSLPKNEEKIEESEVSVPKTTFTPTDFTLVTPSKPTFGFEKFTPSKKQIMSVKCQPKLKSKAASVFQDESDDENIEEKGKDEKEDTSKANAEVKEDKTENQKIEDKRKDDRRRERDRSRDRSSERDRKRRRSSSLERRESRHRGHSPRRRRSRSPDTRSSKESKIMKNNFDVDSSKSSAGSKEIDSSVQPITVVTGLGAPPGDQHWNRSHLPGYSCNDYSSNLMDSFDIYPSEDSKLRGNRGFEKDWEEIPVSDKPYHREDRKKKESRRSRSRSASPRKRRRSKSPDRRRSPKRSPYSPRRRSPKRRGSPRRYRSSRSPDRRRKSRSRSPRRRRESPRRSRSMSPRKHRSSPKRRGDSPRRRNSFSPRRSMSPRKESHYSSVYSENSNLPGRIPVIGASTKDIDSERRRSPRFDDGFPPHVADPTGAEDITTSFYSREYDNEFGYPEDPGANNLITVKNHDVGKVDSPERLTLDQRIELELGVRISSASANQEEQYAVQNQQFQDSSHFNTSYSNDGSVNDNFYQNHGVPPDFNGQYFNGTQPGTFSQFPPHQPPQSSVMQVGNIMEVVPAMHHPPPLAPQVPPKSQQIMQVGNVLQVVPSSKVVPQGQPGPLLQGSPMPPPSHGYGLPGSAPPLVKTQKATAVVAPSSIVPTPNPEAVINPLIKAIQIEREKRRKEKEKRKAEREARRRARQLRREAKLMSVNEKLKKSVVDEGLMLGQEVEDEELLDSLDLPSPPVPVEIITVSSQSSLPPAGKGILISAGFVPKPASEKKEVKFADGVLPGEGTSSSAGEEIASPPPKPKLPKEKRFKKKKTKVKKKVKVQIIKQIIQDEDDDDDDDLSPPPPPPGDPPPVFFAKFPFAGDAQFPVYQTQTTTTTLTTVQFPAQPF